MIKEFFSLLSLNANYDIIHIDKGDRSRLLNRKDEYHHNLNVVELSPFYQALEYGIFQKLQHNRLYQVALTPQ